ncbi:MAG TPA: DUF1348 family protein [Bryobacteraceae bacterium]
MAVLTRELRWQGTARRYGLNWKSVATIVNNELWEFDESGLMRRRIASINDAEIDERDRRVLLPERPA